MISEAMAVQDESGGIRSNSAFTSENAISLSAQLKDQFPSGNNDFSPKVRKPYTITKQRERWTEEEHRKFLEALKLYGRAWRKIEEHVGTKTAVQIRSHAQKFFFKVSRDPNGSNTNPEDPIEIPPPRPKRKPMHPYPRKIVQSPSKEMGISDHSARSLSPNFSFSDQENRSPKSVLSVMGSEMADSNGSDTPDGSLSPVSYASGIRDEISALSEPNPSSGDSGSPSSLVSASVSVPTAKFPVKLELFTQENVHAKGCSTKETSSRSLKLFGRTMLVTESRRSSPSPPDISKPLPFNEHREKSLPGHLPQTVQALHLMHFHNENSNIPGPTSPTAMPFWPFYGGLNFPVMQFNNPEPVKESLESNLHKGQDRKLHMVNSFANVDACSELDLLQRKTSLDRNVKEQESVFKLKPSSRSAFSQLRIRTDKYRRGFVPYKKNTAEEETRSSTISGDESEEKRTNLCL